MILLADKSPDQGLNRRVRCIQLHTRRLVPTAPHKAAGWPTGRQSQAFLVQGTAKSKYKHRAWVETEREREREIGRWMDGSMDGRRDGWIHRWIVHNNHGKFGHECVPAHSSQKCDFWQLWISSTWLTWLPARLRWHPRFRLCPSAVSPPKAKSLVSLASFIESLISLVQPLVSVWQTLWQSLVSFLFVTSFLFVPQLWSCFKICKASGTKILRTFTLRVWTLCTTKPAHKNYTVRFFLKVALSYIILYSIIVSTKLGFGPFAWADLKSTK